MPVGETERVEVWNTFFKFARDEAASLKRLQNPTWVAKQHNFLGGTLDDNKMHSLAVIAWCLLALEAREAHLIELLKEEGNLTPEQAKAVHFLGIKEKWALIPKLAGKHINIDFKIGPHQAVAQLDALRNKLFHVKYESLIRDLPHGQQAVSIFNQFVYAMEDMNVILRCHKKHHKRVLSIALDKVI